MAQERGSTMVPHLRGTPSGSRYTFPVGTRTYPAKAPSTVTPIAPQSLHRLPRPRRHSGHRPQKSDGSTATNSPSGTSEPSPDAMTSPQNSWPGTIGYGVGANSPS